jgi:copper chaperone NosL
MIKMSTLLERWEKLQDTPLNLKSRIFTFIASLSVVLTFLFPLWRMQFFATFYPDGLKLYIYSYKLEGGKTAGRDDLREINTLNHYIWMKPLSQSDFAEFTYLSFIFGALGLLTLRAVVLGKISTVIDFYNKLYTYGHNFAPDAPIKVQPFTPPLFGKKLIAQFTVYSYPDLGSAGILLAIIFLALALIFSGKEAKS